MTKATRERLEGMTVSDLKDLAGRLKVEVPSKARKAELVKAIGTGWEWEANGEGERWRHRGGKDRPVARKRAGKATRKAQQKPDRKPTAQDLIRAGLAAGETNEEIRDRVLKVHPDSKIQKNPTGWVGWTIGQERKKGSPWWQKHGERVAKARGVALEPERAAASSEPKGKGKANKKA